MSQRVEQGWESRVSQKLRFGKTGSHYSLISGTTATIPVVVDDGAFRSVTLELARIGTSHTRSRFDLPESETLSSVQVDDGSTQVSLDVPPGLSPPFQGELVSWSYELRLRGDQFGRDEKVVTPVDIETPPAGTGGAVEVRASSRTSSALQGSRLVDQPGISIQQHLAAIVLFLLVLGGVGLALWMVGLEPGRRPGGTRLLVLIVSEVLVAGLLVELWRRTLGRAMKMSKASLTAVHNPVARGQDILVDIGLGGLPNLEVGVAYYELATGDRLKILNTVIVERFQAATEGRVALAALVTDPPLFSNKRSAVHCLVVLRPKNTFQNFGFGAVSVDVRP